MPITNSLLDYDIPEIDPTVPSVARVYASYLDYDGVFPADRKMADHLDTQFPGIRPLAINNRLSLFNAVQYAVQELGIRQILDHGTGIPVMGSVYEVAYQLDPNVRVVMADGDPIVLAECIRQKIELPDNAAYRLLDMRSPTYVQDLIADKRTLQLINFREPVALLFVSVVHCIADYAKPLQMIEAWKERLAPGSMIALWGLTSDTLEQRAMLTGMMAELSAMSELGWGRSRRRDEYDAFLRGLTPVGPGFGDVVVWGGTPSRVQAINLTEYGGVGVLTA